MQGMLDMRLSVNHEWMAMLFPLSRSKAMNLHSNVLEKKTYFLSLKPPNKKENLPRFSLSKSAIMLFYPLPNRFLIISTLPFPGRAHIESQIHRWKRSYSSHRPRLRTNNTKTCKLSNQSNQYTRKTPMYRKNGQNRDIGQQYQWLILVRKPRWSIKKNCRNRCVMQKIGRSFRGRIERDRLKLSIFHLESRVPEHQIGMW